MLEETFSGYSLFLRKGTNAHSLSVFVPNQKRRVHNGARFPTRPPRNISREIKQVIIAEPWSRLTIPAAVCRGIISTWKRHSASRRQLQSAVQLAEPLRARSANLALANRAPIRIASAD
jgi:hypothetical protein